MAETKTLVKILNWFCVQDNITFLIAVAGFIMSLITTVRNAFNARESYSIEVIDYAFRDSHNVQFLICITNRSDSALSIIDIKVFETICELYPKKIYGEPENWNFRHTANFPLCIPAHGCQHAYLEFLDGSFQADRLGPGKTVRFEIRSTRRQVRKNVTLGNESHYLHTRNQTRYHRDLD